MSLWGAESEKKPSWLTKDQREKCFASKRGWVLKRPNGMEELIVSIPNLDERTGLVSLNIISLYSKGFKVGQKLTVKLSFNEAVTLSDDFKLPLQFGLSDEIDDEYVGGKEYKAFDKIKVENGESFDYCICKKDHIGADNFADDIDFWTDYVKSEAPVQVELPFTKGNGTNLIQFEHVLTEGEQGEIIIRDLNTGGLFDLKGFEYSAFPYDQNTFPVKTGIVVYD